MDFLEQKFWDILEIARNGELNEIGSSYLKDGLGNLFERYLIKDITYEQFLEWFKGDIETKEIDIVDLLESLYKIYYLHRDLASAIEFKKEKIKYKKKSEQSGIEYDYYELANIYYDKGKHKKALESLEKLFKRIDTKNLDISTLELYIRSKIMQNQLMQDIKTDKDEIIKELKSLESIFLNTAKYFDEKKQIILRVQILYLNMNYYLNSKEYDNAVKYGEKIVEILDVTNAPIKISLKYRVYEGLAYSYLLEKNYKKAVDTAKRAIKLKNTLLSIETFSALIVLAESYLALNEYEEALNYAYKANECVKNSFKKLEYVYELLAKIYKAKNDENGAKQYLEKLCQLQEVQEIKKK
jgi:tetratricopeptide (TPR) repeat protein